MNIKYGMDNFYVRYLKRFLNQELISSTTLGKFDKKDLKQLVKYLNLPNVKTMFEVQKEIIKVFPELGMLFNVKLQDNSIQFTSKHINEQTSSFLKNNISKLKAYCSSVGWQIDNIIDWIDISKDINNDGNIDDEDKKIITNIMNGIKYDDITMKRADLNLDGFVNYDDLIILNNYMVTGKLHFNIKKSNRKNYFPNKDMLVFINQFDGTFMYNYAIRDKDGIDDYPHPNPENIYKIALYECKPGQKVTIAHNSPVPVKLIIGSSPATLKQNIPNFMLSNVIETILKPGDSIQYTCSSREEQTGFDAHYLCIQCPSNYGDLSGHKTKTLQLDTGDINFDGKIDMEDYHLLASYTAIGPSAEELHWNPTPKQLAVMNCRKDETSPEIDVRDAEYLYRFIQGDPRIPTLGFSYYDVEVNAEYTEGNNVKNLLIIDGHYSEDTNIPFIDFVNDDWIIHEKFFNYLLGMSIHKYSKSEDITYLQQILKEYYPEHIYNNDFFYPGRYDENMQKLLKDYQTNKINYTTGDLNKDNSITSIDLKLLENYMHDSNDYNRVKKYLLDPDKYPLTEEDIIVLDQDGDGKITEKDLKILDNKLAINYSAVLRARADINGDGFVDEIDYNALKSIIETGSATIEQNGEKKVITLKQYDIPFILGWLDVQTEALLEKDYNNYGIISEVSK